VARRRVGIVKCFQERIDGGEELGAAFEVNHGAGLVKFKEGCDDNFLFWPITFKNQKPKHVYLHAS
jgi:hypothetical protein